MLELAANHCINVRCKIMKSPFLLLFFVVVPCFAGKTPNVLLICVDDLRPELGCYGVDYIQSPRIDELASRGILFQRHYVQAPTCGASRYALLTGTFGPHQNDALFSRARKLAQDPGSVSPSLPAWFREHGYETVSIGKVSHHPGGFGGSNWDDPTHLEMPLSWDQSLMPTGPWQHPRGAMHGLANGEIRREPSEMDVYQSFDGPDRSYPDGFIADGAVKELQRLAAGDKPFFLAVGFIRPHLPFGAPAKYMPPYAGIELPKIPHPERPQEPSTWHKSNEFMRYNRWGRNPNEDAEFALQVRRHYAACVSYVDTQVGLLLDRLKALNLDDKTIVVLWGDHGWHLGEHAVWGKHTLFEESLRSPLIIRDPGRIETGQQSDAVVETIDLFPTLCELTEIPVPEFLDGRSLMPQINHPAEPGLSAVSYWNSTVTLRSETHRLIVHTNGDVELYSHLTPEKETLNIAQANPQLVLSLAKRLHARSPGKLPEILLEKIIEQIGQSALLNADKSSE